MDSGNLEESQPVISKKSSVTNGFRFNKPQIAGLHLPKEFKRKNNQKVKKVKSDEEKLLANKNSQKATSKKRAEQPHDDSVDTRGFSKSEAKSHQKSRSNSPSPIKKTLTSLETDELMYDIDRQAEAHANMSPGKLSPKKYIKSPIKSPVKRSPLKSPIKSNAKSPTKSLSSPNKAQPLNKSPKKSKEDVGLVNDIFLSNLSPEGFDEDDLLIVHNNKSVISPQKNKRGSPNKKSSATDSHQVLKESPTRKSKEKSENNIGNLRDSPGKKEKTPSPRKRIKESRTNNDTSNELDDEELMSQRSGNSKRPYRLSTPPSNKNKSNNTRASQKRYDHEPMDCELGEGEEENLDDDVSDTGEGEEEGSYLEIPPGMTDDQFIEYLHSKLDSGELELSSLGIDAEADDNNDEEHEEDDEDTEYLNMEAVKLPAYMNIRDPKEKSKYFDRLNERYFEELTGGKKTPKQEAIENHKKQVNFRGRNKVKGRFYLRQSS